MGCCVCVPQASIGMIERFGKFDREAPAGLHCLWFCCEGVPGYVSLKVHQLTIKCETKTRDNVFVNLEVVVQYEAIEESAYDAFYKLTNHHGQITSYVYDVVRASVPRISIDEVFTTKEEIAHEIKEQLSKVMESYGYDIKQALITDIQPDPKVKKAMNQINAAQRLRVAAQDKAEAEKIRIVKSAEADAESKYLSGVGISRQRLAIVEGLRDSVMGFTGNVDGCTTKDVMDLVLVTQYFDSLKDIGAACGDTTLFLPHSPGAISAVGEQIKKGFLPVSEGMFSGTNKKSVPKTGDTPAFKTYLLGEKKLGIVGKVESQPKEVEEEEKETEGKGKEKKKKGKKDN